MMELVLPLITEENASLPLSVNVVARYWNVEIPLPSDERYPPNAGSVLIEGLELAEAHGLSTCIAKTDLPELRRCMDTGVPPIVILPGVGNLTHHLSVVSGYEPDTVLHYIPKSSKEGIYEGAIPNDTFYEKWSQEGCITILVAPAEILEATGVADSSSVRLCMEAERATLLGMDTRAESFLRTALSKDKSNVTAWLLLAGMQNRRNLQECVASYQKCIQLNPRCYLAYRGLGNYYLKADDLLRAEHNYAGAINIDSNRSGVVYKNRAYIREKLGKFVLAADDLAMYVKLAPAAPDRGVMERAILELRRM